MQHREIEICGSIMWPHVVQQSGSVISLLTVVFCWGCGRAPNQDLTHRSVGITEKSDAHQAQARAPQPNDWFEDVATQVGIQAQYQSGRSASRNTILETVGGGVGLVDFDRDSYLDIYTVGGGQIDSVTGIPRGVPGRLFRQFKTEEFLDVTSHARLFHAVDYSHGILAGDYDNDGFLDLFLTCYGQCQLWRNLGDGTFQSVTEPAGLGFSGWNTAAALADMNSDGNLDLFVAGYVDWTPESSHEGGIPSDVPPPQQYAPLADHLFLSMGDGRFTDISAEAGIRTDGMGLGVLACDLNGDSRADIYVANDVVGNHCYLGGTTFPLSEIGESAGLAYNESGTPEGSMGIDAEDVNGDGLPDLWLTNFELEDNSLYLNLGGGQFRHATAQLGLAGLGRNLVGFGTGLQDFDGDGWPDIYILNGHVQYHSKYSPFAQPAFLLKNRTGKRFDDVSEMAGSWFSIPHTARGGATGDWNNDGALDLVISCLDEPLVVLRNRVTAKPVMHLQLVGSNSARDSIGATVRVRTTAREVVHYVKSGCGYLSQSDTRIIIPIAPDQDFVEIVVNWPSQFQERFQVIPKPGPLVLVEGHGLEVQ